MKGISIRQQLLMATLIPITIVAIAFALFYNIELNSTLKEHTAHLGETYVNQLLPAAQLTIIEGNTRSLQGLVDSVATNDDVLSIAFYDANGDLLAYRGSGTHPKKHIPPPTAVSTTNPIESKKISQHRLRFFAPITLQRYNLYKETRVAPFMRGMKHYPAQEVLGWLSIDLDTKPMFIKKYHFYLASILITVLAGFLGLLAHAILSKKIAYPIKRLYHTMRQLSNEAYKTPIKVKSPGELGVIEAGCAKLQKQYLTTLDEFNQHVDTATQDLQQSLELLEEKNVQLLLDRRKAEEALKQKSVLMTSLSHEIRTPMNGIIGFANILLETSLSPIARDYVKTIKSSAKDLLALLNNILDYAKINAGKLKLDAIPFDIRSSIDDVLAIAAPNAHKKGLDLIPSTAVDVPQMMVGDPIRLKQIINNLISNAIKFTSQGHIVIRTRVENTTEHTYTICLSVTDTGIGISKEEQASLFHPFHQASENTTRRYGGSGLGLVICKQLAEHMQGTIALKSHANQGSIFSVHLTFAKLPAYEIEKNTPKRFSHVKAICFDTNTLYLEALCNGLGHLGISCIEVCSIEALTSAFEIHTDAQLAFIHLTPEYESTLKTLLSAQDIPILLMSKWPVEDYQALGAKGFLLQPPNIQKLEDQVESLLLQATTTTTRDQGELECLRKEMAHIYPNLLIAEDNAVNQMLLNAWLSHYASIDLVDNGEQALAICHQKAFDAILIDLHMPKLDGLEAAHMIRKQTTLNQETPIILISADNHDLDQASLDEHQIDRKLPKPIEEGVLLHHLLHVLNKAKQLPINWPACIQKMSGNAVLAREFLDRFVAELPQSVAAIQTGSLQEVAHIAHTLRGASSFCAVPSLEASLAKLEYLAQHNPSKKDFNQALEDTIHQINLVIKAHQTLNFVTETS